MTMNRILLTVAASGLLLSACNYEGESIQRQYNSDRQECREYAESVVGGARPSGPFFPGAEGEHIDLVRQFAHCMHKRGWSVNKPPEDGAE